MVLLRVINIKFLSFIYILLYLKVVLLLVKMNIFRDIRLRNYNYCFKDRIGNFIYKML